VLLLHKVLLQLLLLLHKVLLQLLLLLHMVLLLPLLHKVLLQLLPAPLHRFGPQRPPLQAPTRQALLCSPCSTRPLLLHLSPGLLLLLVQVSCMLEQHLKLLLYQLHKQLLPAPPAYVGALSPSAWALLLLLLCWCRSRQPLLRPSLEACSQAQQLHPHGPWALLLLLLGLCLLLLLVGR
jgi:hypothetical protein